MGPTAIVAAIVGATIVFGLCAIMGRKAWMRFGKLEIGVERINKKSDRIDEAVNHSAPGQPRLKEQVDYVAREVSREFKELHRRLDVSDNRMNAIDQRQAECETRLGDIASYLRRLEEHNRST